MPRLPPDFTASLPFALTVLYCGFILTGAWWELSQANSTRLQAYFKLYTELVLVTLGGLGLTAITIWVATLLFIQWQLTTNRRPGPLGGKITA